MIFREQPDEPWTDFDFALIEAYQTIQDETCPQCGNPVWLCRSDSKEIYASVKTGECRGAKALEKYKDSKKSAKDRAKKEEAREWGKSYFVEFDLLPIEKADGKTMPTRKDYYEGLKNRP